MIAMVGYWRLALAVLLILAGLFVVSLGVVNPLAPPEEDASFAEEARFTLAVAVMVSLLLAGGIRLLG